MSYDYELLSDQNYNSVDCRIKNKIYKKRKDVLSIYGMLYISKENYAVVRATLKSSKNLNVNFVNNFIMSWILIAK